MRIPVLLLLGLQGCQCFQPVSEELDAGGSIDAGFDAGRPECAQASDCVPMSAPRNCGFASAAPTRSCFDGRCIYDCEGPRSCSTKLGSCLSCDGGVPTCSAAACMQVTEGSAGRLYRSCVAGQSEQLGTFVLRYRTGATCNFRILSSDGGVLGSLDLLGANGTGSAEMTAEPGVTCSVRGLATALNRIELGCAQCLYMLEWP